MPGNRRFNAARPADTRIALQPLRRAASGSNGAAQSSGARSSVSHAPDETLECITSPVDYDIAPPPLCRDPTASLLASVNRAAALRPMESCCGELPPNDLPSESCLPDNQLDVSLDHTVDEELFRSFLYVGPNYRAQLRRSEAILLFAAYRMHRALSDAASLDLHLIADSLLPAAGLGVDGAEVAELLRDELASFALHLELYCVACSSCISTEVSACSNKRCERFRAPIRTDGANRYRAVATCRLEPQLRRILERHSEAILASIARAKAGPHADKADLCDWPDFLSNASRDDPTHVWLTAYLSADGFPIKDNYKGECWPILLQICELPLQLRESYDNTVIAGCFVGTSKPTQADWRRLLIRLRQELVPLEESGVVVQMGDKVIAPLTHNRIAPVQMVTMHFRIVNTVMDLAAVASAYNLKTWAGKFSCAICEISGARLSALMGRNDVPTVVVFPPQDNVNLRTGDRIAAQMDLAEQEGSSMFGFKGRSAMQTVICCSKRLPESLHTLGEGIFADVVARLLDPRSPVGMSAQDVAAVDTALRTALFPTNFPRDLNNLSRFRTASYHEKELVGICILPILFALCVTGDALKSATYLLISYAARLLAAPILTAANAQKVAALCTAIRTCFPFVVGLRYCTLKLHYFVEHVPFLCMTTCTPFDSNSNGFEAFNKQFRYPLNSRRTRGVIQAMLESCLLRKTIFERFARVAAQSQCDQLAELADRWSGKAKQKPRRFVQHCPDGISIPHQSDAQSLVADVDALLTAKGLASWPRFSRLFFQRHTYTAANQWTRASKTCQYDVVLGERNGSLSFARIQLVLVRPETGAVFIVVRPFLCRDPFEQLRAAVRVADNMPRRFRAIYERVFDMLAEECFWQRCDGFGPLRIVQAKRICGYCSLIRYSPNASFILNLMLKSWHE